MMAHFIFEIGFEEFPAGFIVPAAEQMRAFLISELEKARLANAKCQMYSTCSRIAAVITELPEKQPDRKELVTGAPKKVSLTLEGTLSKAGESFLAKNGITEYFFENSDKGEVIAGWKEEKGMEIQEVIIPIVKNGIKALSFKKSMRWGEHKFPFARPIRWIFLSINGKPVADKFEDVDFSLTSFGHRFLANGPLTVSAQDYEKVLKGHFVIADRDERKKMINESVNAIADKNQLIANIEENLLDEVTDMVEYPHVIVGTIPEKYSHLPAELITKVLKKDQRYFVLCEQGEKTVVKKFASVLNNIPTDDSVVVKGNEKVVSARLADAAFYFTDDLEKDFHGLKEKLREVLFQKDLGTYHDKIVRIGKIAEFVAKKFFKAEESQLEKIKTASEMIKNDLVTGVVFEFPDLQGIMGRYYAEHAGFDPEISKAVYEHYLPVNAGDLLPSTLTGTVLSIADKVDTITGGFMAGMKPTGSKDKFAIRRNGISLLTLAVENESASVNLRELFEFAGGLILEHNGKLKLDVNEIMEFMTARYNAVLNFETPVIQASTATGADIPAVVKKRAETINRLLKDNEITGLAQLYKRGCNILKKQENIFGEPVESLFELAEEKNLFKAADTLCQEIVNMSDNLEIALKIITIKPVLDSFFDAVFVMAEDENIRMNRMRLINKVTTLVIKNIGDISYLNI